MTGLRLASLVVIGCTTRPIRPPDHEARGPARDVIDFRWEQRLTAARGAVYQPEEFATPVVDAARRRIYVGSAAGGFYALSMGDGRILYRVATGGGVRSTPLSVAHLGRVFFGSDDGALYAVEADGGALAWRYETRGAVRGAPAYNAGVLFFTTAEDRVYAVEARSGRWRWHYEREAREGFTIHGQSGAVAAQGRVFAGFSDGHVVALDARTGDVLWAHAVGQGGPYVDADGTPVFSPDGRALYVTAYRGGVYALDPADGTVRWHHPVEGATRVTVDEDRLYFSSPIEGVSALDHGGRVVWRQVVRQGSLSAPVLAGRHLAITASQTGLLIVSREDGRLQGFFKTGAGVSAEPVVTGQDIHFVSNTGFLYSATLR
jgi:outer membrane protein assembly factor BamB